MVYIEYEEMVEAIKTIHGVYDKYKVDGHRYDKPNKYKWFGGLL